MTREEEVIKASHLYAKHQQKPFIDGAMWADKTMIERACKFFWSLSLEKMDEYFSSSENLYQFTEDFKKAMEE